MNRKLLFVACAVLTASAGLLQGQIATTTSLVASPASSVLGTTVTLTATVAPNTAPGKVTFFDGSFVVGIANLSAGTAQLTTALLPAGIQKVTARYDGAAGVDPSTSAPFVETVTAQAATSLTQAAVLTAGTNPAAVAVGDFNGDNKADLVVANQFSNNVTVFVGLGDGTFVVSALLDASLPDAIAIGDFNGDGQQDIAIAENSSSPSHVRIFLGNGDGTFPTTNEYDVGLHPFSLAAADFNGDGIVDLVTSNSGDNNVSVLLGNPDGTFQTQITTAVSGFTQQLVAGDFNGDGKADVAVAVFDLSNVTILLGNGDGTFTAGSTYLVGSNPVALTMADFNGDGRVDLATANSSDGTASILLGNGNGTFSAEPTVAGGFQTAKAIAAGDFNGDGKLDLMVGNSGQASTVTLLTGNNDGTFNVGLSYAAGLSPSGLAVADFNSDGKSDLAVSDGNGSPGVTVLTGSNGTCTFTVTPPSLALDSAGGAPTLTVTASAPSCAFTTSTNVVWIAVSPGLTGSGSVTVTVQNNDTAVDRVGTVLVGGQSINVLQNFTVQAFPDVSPSAYYFDAVNELKGRNITAGCAGGNYCPDLIVTRDQMAIFVIRSVYGNDNFEVSPLQHFNDVNSTTFGYQWIQKMYELGISAGCGNNNYCPTTQVTRDQMAIFIIRARYAATTLFTWSSTPFFTDVPDTNFAFQYIQRMEEDAITAGCGGTQYCPGSPVIRGDMAIFIMRGGFNQLLPAGVPVIQQISPNTITAGNSGTYTVTGVNTNFVDGVTTMVATGGITPSGLAVIGPTQFTVTLTADADALIQPEPVYVQTGTEEAVMPNGLIVAAPTP